jgi:hypothetical protein
MKLGIHLYELSRLRWALLLSFVLAAAISVSTAYKITVLPPGLHPKAMAMSAASTHVLVDSRNSVLLNLGVGADQLDQMTQRALLVGNVMASIPVRQYIADRAGVPEQAIQMTSPLTPLYPRPIADDPQSHRSTTDLLKSNNQYRINIKSNPTVPILDIYTEASSPKTAVALANATVAGMRDYLATIAETQHVPPRAQVHLDQLGTAQGGSVTGSVNVEVATLLFLFVFALSCVASLVVARVLKGWRLGAETRQMATATAATNGKAPSNGELHRAAVT